ncbi:hypothetical protein BDV06DRAFT_205228 [Aspergillus oleicola]
MITILHCFLHFAAFDFALLIFASIPSSRWLLHDVDLACNAQHDLPQHRPAKLHKRSGMAGELVYRPSTPVSMYILGASQH